MHDKWYNVIIGYALRSNFAYIRYQTRHIAWILFE